MAKNKKYWQEQIDRLVQYCDDKKWEVTFKGNGPDLCFPADKEIEIGLYQSTESVLYSLIHEVGHMIENQNKEWYKKKYKGLNYNKGSKIHKVDRVQEEYSAWNSGLKVARKLKIEINERNFLKIKSYCIFSYMEEVVDSKNSGISV